MRRGTFKRCRILIAGLILLIVFGCTIFQRDSSACTEDLSFREVPESAVVEFQPAPNEESVPVAFRLKAHRFEAEAKPLRESSPFRTLTVTFPSPVETDVEANNTVWGEYFQPAGPGPFPGVVVLHILGGEFPLSQTVASSLARAKVAALFIKMPYYGERRSKESPRRMISRNPRETAEAMTQAVLDIRRAAAWLASRPEVDHERLGITGISLGGIMSALSAAGEPRFRKVAIYLGGGKLGENLWNMPHQDAEAFRAEWIKMGESRESFLKLLEPVDPVTHAGLLKDRDVLMVNAKHDEIIPHAATMALWEAIGTKPELVWLDAGHITAAAYLPGEMVRLQRFFTNWQP
jgi:dienelactone hydrolase